MRVSEALIKQAILHTEGELRDIATRYFTWTTSSRDPEVMPLVIQAVETYGRPPAFPLLRAAEGLLQTPATIQWLTSELQRECDVENVDEDNYRSAIALVLHSALPELLTPDMAQLRSFPEELQLPFLERLQLASSSWQQLWDVLKEMGHGIDDEGEIRLRHLRRGQRIVEALARHRDHAGDLLEQLNQDNWGNEDWLWTWLEPFLLDLAGQMQIQEAVPMLATSLSNDDWFVSEHALTALENIRTDAVVVELARLWPAGSDNYRRAAAETMGHIPTDLSVQKCLAFLATERDEDTRDFLANAALGLFATDAIEPARQLVLGDWDDLVPDRIELRYRLIAATTIMQESFAECQDWLQYAIDHNWGWKSHDLDRIRYNFTEDDDEDELDDEFDDEFDEDDDEWMDEIDFQQRESGEAPRLSIYPPRVDPVDETGGESGDPTQPIRNVGQRTGRNDPCPCGSGKKFKNCCMKKGAKEDTEE